ncbi:MAG: MFS transporter [Bacteroidales bacterium]|mgnify:CR=1 FL=1|jgi:fucose permease|nr:MFS transporter [Bacteroidales bacterium]
MINNNTMLSNRNLMTIKWLTYLMFMMFAMTTDAVGEIIRVVMKQFDLSMTSAGLLHYGPMTAIALGGIMLGFMADRFGRKTTIIVGLSLFALNSLLFIVGNSFGFFLMLLMISGLAIGIFKTAALALIGDISTSTKEHTSTMNMVEGFFGVGAILGTFLVSYLLSAQVEWKYLYVVAAVLSLILIGISLLVKYPASKVSQEEPVNLARTLKMLKDPYALGFSFAAFLYVAVESAIYVWMPTLLEKYEGNLLLVATYSLSIFFFLRAGGRFLGAFILSRFNWSGAMVLFSAAIFLCFLFSIIGGVGVAVLLLPLSGLFMSVLYPTINSKGISCFPKSSHGAVAGVILFFTAAGAAFGPLTMGAASDAFGKDPLVGFILATVFAGVLLAGTVFNALYSPTAARLKKLDESEY